MKKTMKTVGIAVMLLLAFSFSACIAGSGNPNVVPENQDAEKVAAAKDALSAMIPAETDGNLALPTKLDGFVGMVIAWQSSDEAVVSVTGAVVRQDDDVTVTLTATLTLGEANDTREFTVAVSRKPVSEGSFHFLNAAWFMGWITTEEYKTVAYYHNNGREYKVDGTLISQPSDHVPIPKNPEVLREDIENQIKQDFIIAYLARCGQEEHNVQIRYYGTYSGAVVVWIDSCMGYEPEVPIWDPLLPEGLYIAYGTGQRVLVWKQNE